ncbi:MAG: hypothetical protein IPJ65_23600 [Archangiaceae bacterium]|nr:hypothetical protein [Archangiaceae bacterium]
MRIWVVTATFSLLCACDCGDRTMTVDGRLSVSPASLDFGQQEPGSSTTLPLTLTNSGAARLEVIVTVVDDPRMGFGSSAAMATVGSGQSATLDITWQAPSTSATEQATLRLETNASATPEVLVPLLARAVKPCIPRACADLKGMCGDQVECGGVIECGPCGADAGANDAGAGDAGASDAGASDAGASDAGASDAGASDAGASDAGASDAGENDGGIDAGYPVDPSRHYVFTTSASYTGNLGGQAGADAKCRAAAAGARLPGGYRALVVVGSQGLADRVPDAGPWYRVDGQLAFQDVSEVLSAPRVPLNVDQSGRPTTGFGSAWTGLIKYAGLIGSKCADWTTSNAGSTGKAGRVSVTTSSWIDDNPSACPGSGSWCEA